VIERRYQTVQASTASRERLMVLLFETALRHMRAAATALDEGRRADGAKAAIKASDIVIELHATLDRSRAPEMCDQLASLYRFVCGRLLTASTRGDSKAAREAERVFAPLADAFSRVVEAGAAK
jgi:flagellar protein FliS